MEKRRRREKEEGRKGRDEMRRIGGEGGKMKGERVKGWRCVLCWLSESMKTPCFCSVELCLEFR